MSNRIYGHGPPGGGGPGGPMGPQAPQKNTDFRYALPHLLRDPDKLLPEADTTRDDLLALGAQMANPPDDSMEGNSRIPAGYTYWGQFIDHDITMAKATDESELEAFDILEPFSPVGPEDVESGLQNEREPIFDLDSVYGKGPSGSPEMYESDQIHLRLGVCVHEIGPNSLPVPGEPPNPELDGGVREGLRNDLPREQETDPNPRRAIIGDGRNDENVAVAQFHTAFLHFHNAVVDQLAATRGLTGEELFEEARRQVRFHYQWLVVHDYLVTVCGIGAAYRGAHDAANFIRWTLQGGFTPSTSEQFMPLEFAVAAFRFGHTMVRPTYDFNHNFGRPEPGLAGSGAPRATFRQLFEFTGGGGLEPHLPGHPNPASPPGRLGPNPQLPFNWIIRWPRFFFDRENPEFEDRFARKIDTNLAPPLAQMFKEIAEVPAGASPTMQDIVQHLAQRNLLRGYRLSLPTGQAVAEAMKIADPLTPAELTGDPASDLGQAVTAGGFDQRTPLWFYILREAEVRQMGGRLGEMGGRLVAGTLVGLLLTDSDCFMARGWTPDQGIVKQTLGRFSGIRDLLEFAGVAPPVAVGAPA